MRAVRFSWVWLWMGAGLFCLGCRRAPAWLSEAPLIGYRYTDDKGVGGYLSQPPQRVAVLSPAALGLWQTARLPHISLYGCLGFGEETQNFYLPCEDPSALIDVLYRNRVEWIWADMGYPWPEVPAPPAPVYHFRPASIADWLSRLSLLARIYDYPALHQAADSLRTEIDSLTNRLSRERRFKVLMVGFSDSVVIYSSRHPLGQIAEAAGGQPPQAEAPFVSPRSLKEPPFLPDILILPAEKTDIVNALLLEMPELYSSSAILNRRVFSMPRELMQEPYLNPAQTFYLLVRILHPEAIGSAASTLPETAPEPQNEGQ